MSLKKTKSKESSVSERRFGVILEDINSTTKQIFEGHAALDKKIEDFKHETRNELKFVNFALKNLSEGQKDIIVRLDRFEDKTEKNFQAIKEYLSRIDDEIQDLKKVLYQKADLERLERLEKRFAEVELVVKKWQE